MPQAELQNFITVLETTIYLVAANLPPLRSLAVRAYNAANDFAKGHNLARLLKPFNPKPQRWQRRLRTVEEGNNKSPDLLNSDSPRARLGYVPTQQITHFGNDLRKELDEGFNDNDGKSL